MEFRILGPLEVFRNGRAVSLGGAKQRALLAILVLEANKTVAMERLTDLLWSEQAPATAQHALEVYISQLRRALEPEGAPYRTLLTGPAGYTLRVEGSAVDASRFEHLLEGAARLGPQARLDQLNEALGLWRGPALADFASEAFAVGESARLNELRLLAREERIDAELALGRHAAVIGELVALTNEHPLRERLCGQLMLALYRTGRQAEASDAYQRIRDHLVEELGMEPGPELQALLKRILQQDPTLNAFDVDGHDGLGPLTNLPAQLTSFIGRHDQMVHIEQAIAEFRLLTLIGVGGSGKTRLAQQVASRLLDRFPDGVWFIDLAPIADHELVWQAVASSVGIREQAGKPLATTVKGYLKDRKALLVLDNCEHLIAAAAGVAETLLLSCPNLRIIATSRERPWSPPALTATEGRDIESWRCSGSSDRTGCDQQASWMVAASVTRCISLPSRRPSIVRRRWRT